MSTTNKHLVDSALESLKGKWPLAIGTFIVYFICIAIIQSFFGRMSFVVTLLISGPASLGMAIFSLKFSRREEVRFEYIFDGFKNYGKSLGVYLLMVLYVFLWMLLLIIPGIIAALSYSLSFYILADEPTLPVEVVLRKSKKMMDGYKSKLFRMQLRFLGLALLCILTLGIGFLWLIPFIQVTMAHFYDDVKKDFTAGTTAVESF